MYSIKTPWYKGKYTGICYKKGILWGKITGSRNLCAYLWPTEYILCPCTSWVNFPTVDSRYYGTVGIREIIDISRYR